MTGRPAQDSFTKREWKLIATLNTPRKVQRFLSSIPYNWEVKGGTMRSFREVLKKNEAHCLEAAIAAAVILEQHGFPPLVLDLESKDLLDHVIFVYQQDGRWGSIGRSRDIGLHGRRPLFRSLRDLAWSYFDTFVDFSGRLKGYGPGNLYDLGNYDWRFSSRNMHRIEDYLRSLPHKPMISSDKRYVSLLKHYKQYKQRYPGRSPSYYPNKWQWML